MKFSGLGGEMGVYVLAAVVAGVVAFAVTKWFLGYMKHHNTNLFIVYRIALGIVLLGLVATHKISNAPPAPEQTKDKITRGHKDTTDILRLATKRTKITKRTDVI
jgi:hypothetical protein